MNGNENKRRKKDRRMSFGKMLVLLLLLLLVPALIYLLCVSIMEREVPEYSVGYVVEESLTQPIDVPEE